MRKTLGIFMAAAMIAAGSMSACSSSQPAETTAAETTVAETTAEETTVEETTEAASEESSDELSDEEMKSLYVAFAESLQNVIDEKDLSQIAELMTYPAYIGIDDGVVVESEEDFLKLDADKVFTDELIKAVEEADLDATEVTEAGFVVGDPSGKPNVTFGLGEDGKLGITGINY